MRKKTPPWRAVPQVELEHTEVLGDTLGAIAAEKAAIASAGGALVACVSPALVDGVCAVARERRVRSCTILPPSDDHDADNLELARLALDELGRRGSTIAGACGAERAPRLSRRLLASPQLQRARCALPARQESLVAPCGTPVLLDAAHTAASAGRLALSVRRGGPSAARSVSPPVLLVGMLDDKDHDAVAAALCSLSPLHAVCVPLGAALSTQPRAQTARSASLAAVPPPSSTTVQRALVRAGCASVEVKAEAAEALDAALATARRHGTWVLVAGSFRLCGAVRPLLLPPRSRVS